MSPTACAALRANQTMKILPNNTPYVASPSKMARTQMRQELNRLRDISDLRLQNEGARAAVEFAGQTVFFSRGLSAESPLFVQHTVQGSRRVHILSKDNKNVGVFDSRGNDTWERRALLYFSAEILASLPKRAFLADVPVAPASEKQIAVVRKVLEIPADEPLPLISSLAAGRLIDRVTVEKAAFLLAENLESWLVETVVEVPGVVAA
jgi:hypothetical protein